MFLWGSNESRQLGFATDGGGDIQYTPKKLPFGIRIADVTGGRSHTVLVTETGHTYTWGAQAWGQLGIFREKAPFPFHFLFLSPSLFFFLDFLQIISCLLYFHFFSFAFAFLWFLPFVYLFSLAFL